MSFIASRRSSKTRAFSAGDPGVCKVSNPLGDATLPKSQDSVKAAKRDLSRRAVRESGMRVARPEQRKDYTPAAGARGQRRGLRDSSESFHVVEACVEARKVVDCTLTLAHDE